MNEKIIGYTLLVCGIGIILFSAFNVYFVFIGQTQPIHLFNFPAISLDISKSVGLPTITGAKPTELVSADVLNQTSNVFAHLFLMGFIASIGEKLAALGIQLVRPIIIKGKEEKV